MTPIALATAYPDSSEVLKLRLGEAAPNWNGDGVALGLMVTDANVFVAVVDGGTNDALDDAVRDPVRVELLLPLAEAVPDPELAPDTVELPLDCDADAVMLFVDELDD